MTWLFADRAEMRPSGKRPGQRLSARPLSERSARFEESTLAQFGEIKQVLARIEATQADHGRQFEKLAGDLP